MKDASYDMSHYQIGGQEVVRTLDLIGLQKTRCAVQRGENARRGVSKGF